MALDRLAATEDRLGAYQTRAIALARRAEDLVMRGRFAEAEEVFEAARQSTEDADVTLQILCGYARLLVATRRAREARMLAAEMLTLLNEPDTGRIAPWGYAWVSQLLLLANLVDDALRAAEQAVRTADETGLGRAEAYSALASARERANDIHGAIDSLETAMVNMTSPRCLMDARAHHARLALRLGDTESAVRSLLRAVELPDLRDRQVVANVLKTIAEIGSTDSSAAVRLVETLAVHLAKPQE